MYIRGEWFGIINEQITSILTGYLPATRLFSILDDNLLKYQSIFTTLGMCIDIMEISLELLIGKFCQF